jgi:hypothetical protein
MLLAMSICLELGKEVHDGAAIISYLRLFVLALTYVFALKICSAWQTYISNVHLRKKGYRNPLVLVLCVIVIYLAWLVGPFTMTIGHHPYTYYPPVLFSMLLLGPVVVATIVLHIGARLIPPKPRLAARPRVSFPYRLVGWILLAAGIAQLIFFAFLDFYLPEKSPTLASSIRFLLYLVGLSLGCFYFSRRFRAPSADAALQVDPRPPTLYLRAFTYERQVFVAIPLREAVSYSSYPTRSYGKKYGLTLEQYLSGSIRKSIGPFIALGDPLDYEPPEGASRAYEADTNWHERFVEVARESACIIVQAGASLSLQWEFAALKREGLLQKVFVLTSPEESLDALNRSAKIPFLLKHWIKEIKPAVWSEFALEMGGIGLQIDPTEPPPGSILSFNPEASAVLLATSAHKPLDFVSVMLTRLQTNAALRKCTAPLE